MNATLPSDSAERKEIPIVSGCLDYFPAALAGVARVSKAGNDRHNPGQPLHHARGKSTDHADCVVRHLIDLHGLLAEYERETGDDGEDIIAAWRRCQRERIRAEASALAWRSLALSQELHERFGAPLAPGARLPAPDALAEYAKLSQEIQPDGYLPPVDHTPELDGSQRVVQPGIWSYASCGEYVESASASAEQWIAVDPVDGAKLLFTTRYDWKWLFSDSLESPTFFSSQAEALSAARTCCITTNWIARKV